MLLPAKAGWLYQNELRLEEREAIRRVDGNCGQPVFTLPRRRPYQVGDNCHASVV